MWYLQLEEMGTVQECDISNWKNGNSTRMSYLQLEEWEQYKNVVSPTGRMGTVLECGISNWKNRNSTIMWYLQLEEWESTRMWYLQLEEW